MTHATASLASARPDGSGAGPGEDVLTAVRAAGFEGLLWQGATALFGEEPVVPAGLAEACRAAGLRLVVTVDLRRLPLDHPLVEAHPDLFAIRRAADRGTPVDPRRPMPATGEALARLSAHGATEALAPVVIDALRGLAEAGVHGVRLARPEELNGPLVRAIGDALPDHLLIAGPGEDRAVARTLAESGLDFWVSSIAWWDFTSPWLVEEAAAIRPAVPMLAELGDNAGAGGDPGALRRALGAAAALANGLIVPAGLVTREPELAREAVSRLVEVAPFGGAIHRLTGTGAPVTAVLRADRADIRQAGGAMMALVNTRADEQPVPAPALLLPAIGADLEPFRGMGEGDPTRPLEPGEVRLLTAPRARPITGKGGNDTGSAVEAASQPRLVLENITPRVDGGDFAVKRVVGEQVTVEADCFTDGHEQLACELRWRTADDREWKRVRMDQLPNDRWRAAMTLHRLGTHFVEVEGWLDRFGGFRRDFAKKLDAGVAQAVDHQEGRALVVEAIGRCKGKTRTGLERALKAIEKAGDPDASARALLDPALAQCMDAADDRPHRIVSTPQRIDAERLQARFSSWYELFPRSITDDPARHGTFADVIGRLPAIRDMGFDTLYFPPIHPIGKTNRKGPNNTLTPGPDDPGSPYAIGSEAGGHDALHPELGSFEEFGRLVTAAREQGLEIALDFAIQCSPDHPWLKEHPGWFAWRPDGSMKYAENPPKKYQDIVNVDFYGPDAVPGLWTALRDVVLLWVRHGVKLFRVDNPHTKPLPFWEWMIADVRRRHPDVVFLAEAFTRPTMMYRLAKVGFSQSYTYFTWRDRKQELIEYIEELTTTAPKEFYRPHFFVNTPDINPYFLQTSGRPGFRIRAVLAATLSGLFGVYSGFELCESAPIPGKEEYLDSEKYIVKPRDWQAPGNIIADITLLNRLRRAFPALQTHLNTRFLPCHNDNIIWYAKPSPDGSDMILVMVNMDPHHAQEADFELPLWDLGLPDDGALQVEDLAQGHRFTWWGKYQHIRLEPDEPYRIWRVQA